MITTRRFIIAFVIGVTCYVALLLLSARVNPVRGWNYELDRATAIARAREVAARSGVDAAAWRANVAAEYNANSDYYLSTRTSAQASDDARITPVTVQVLLAEPTADAQGFRVGFTADGRLKSIARRNESLNLKPARMLVIGAGDPPAKVNSGATQAPSPDEAIARRVAIETLAQVVGETATQFRFVSQRNEKVGDKQGVRLVLERAYDATPDMKAQASVLVLDDGLRELSLGADFSRSFRTEVGKRQQIGRVITGAGGLLVFLIMLAAPFFYFFMLLKRRIHHRQALILLAAIFLGALAANALGKIDEELISGAMTRTRTATLFSATFEALFISFCYALGFALVWSVGQTFARRLMPLRIASFVALLRGKLTMRFVGASVACGVLMGGALAVVPFVVKAIGLFPGAEIAPPDTDAFVSIAPTIAGLLQPIGFPFFALYGFVLPVLSHYPRLTKISRVVVLLIGGSLFFIDDIAKTSTASSAILTAGVLILIADTIFRRYDFLTLVVALLTAEVATIAVALLATDAPSLNRVGWQVLFALGVVIVSATALRFRGAAKDIAGEIEPDPADELTGTLQAERERLVAGFGVARLAQQRMLPAHPPQIPGYTIAATCRPAREVGGDLYDFVRLPDERIGIVVADVSGKGVPAALYMTLTKGLLASVAETETDPHRILCEVNRHLYEVCRRKVFVTLILGVLDPPTRTLHLARAGHTPTIWRRVRENALCSLRAPGLGLGLDKGALFDRTLKIETVKLHDGDAVLFYSDGITEAMNAGLEEYGDERLQQIVSQTDGMNAEATEREILTDVFEFLGDQAPQDDITLVVLRVTPNAFS